jgi:hypothetical protein
MRSGFTSCPYSSEPAPEWFEHLGGEHIQLETIEVIETRAATHLRYRIVK